MMIKPKFLKAGGKSVEFPRNDRGVTLVETMIAVLVAMIGVFGLGTLIFQATVTNKNQGTEVTRATIYAQDKIEKLLSFGASGAVSTTSANFKTCTQAVSLQPIYCNSTYSCAVATSPCPSASILGITQGGWNTGLKAGGVTVSDPTTKVSSCPTSGASVGYVDFLDANGLLLSGSCATVNGSAPAYIRMWQISTVTSGGVPVVPALKQITVGVWSQAALSTTGAPKPVVVLTSYMSDPN